MLGYTEAILSIYWAVVRRGPLVTCKKDFDFPDRVFGFVRIIRVFLTSPAATQARNAEPHISPFNTYQPFPGSRGLL